VPENGGAQTTPQAANRRRTPCNQPALANTERHKTPRSEARSHHRRWSRDGRACFHTAEVTGSIPVTPTSQNRFPVPILRAACQKICQKITAYVWSHPGQRRSIRAVGEPTNTEPLVRRGGRAVRVWLEHPVSRVHLGSGGLFSDVEGKRQSCVERLDHPGGHPWGGVPIAGADAAATLQLPTATALVAHQLIDHPRRDSLVLQPGRKTPTMTLSLASIVECNTM
jgi:hypothetical protein